MIPIVELIRLEENFDYGTFGVLKINKEVFCVTLEPRDEENTQCISSIPVQQYLCQKIISINFGETYEVTNVPGRSSVLFHAGNISSNTKGCIILGRKFGVLKEKRAVLNSGETFKEFINIMKDNDIFHLTVSEVF